MVSAYHNIAFPVAGHNQVGCFSRSLINADHIGNAADGDMGPFAASFSPVNMLASQTLGQLFSQLSFNEDVQILIDTLR